MTKREIEEAIVLHPDDADSDLMCPYCGGIVDASEEVSGSARYASSLACLMCKRAVEYPSAWQQDEE
jgi:hypothetical protein